MTVGRAIILAGLISHQMPYDGENGIQFQRK
jgi:hypothetical protein